MKRILALALLATLFAGGNALAAEQSVTLKVKNACPTCGYIIKKTLGQVSGVEQVSYSSQDDTATVIFDDSKTDVGTLIATTTSVGFPAEVVE